MVLRAGDEARGENDTHNVYDESVPVPTISKYPDDEHTQSYKHRRPNTLDHVIIPTYFIPTLLWRDATRLDLADVVERIRGVVERSHI